MANTTRIPCRAGISNHVFYMLSQYFDDMDLSIPGKLLSITVWSKKCHFSLYTVHERSTSKAFSPDTQWMFRLNSFELGSILSHECSVSGVHIKPSSIAHPLTRMRCFVNQESIKRDGFLVLLRSAGLPTHGGCTQWSWCLQRRRDEAFPWTIPYLGNNDSKRTMKLG